MTSIRSRKARAAAVEHVEWVRAMCFLASAPGRAVELLERGLSRAAVADALYPHVHGGPNPAAEAPFRTLFVGGWKLDDPELDGVCL